MDSTPLSPRLTMMLTVHTLIAFMSKNSYTLTHRGMELYSRSHVHTFSTVTLINHVQKKITGVFDRYSQLESEVTNMPCKEAA